MESTEVVVKKDKEGMEVRKEQEQEMKQTEEEDGEEVGEEVKEGRCAEAERNGG